MKLKSTSMQTCAAFLIGLALSMAQAAEPPAAGDKAASPARSEPKLSTTAQPRANTSGVDAPASSAAKAPAARKTSDRIDLDTTVVTGNRELPKVLYIVPWKKSDLGDLPAQPFNTLLDEALTPVDRDVFRREVTYYGAMHGGADAPASPPPSSEK